MIITLKLTSELEAKLRQSIAAHDTESVRRLLADAFTPTVEALLQNEAEQLNADEFEAIADQLSEELVTCLGSNAPTLSDYAVSRSGIYEDHP